MENSLDVIWNSSSLVPLTKPMLSNRDSVSHLVVAPGTLMQPLNQTIQVRESQGRSHSPLVENNFCNKSINSTLSGSERTKIKTQATVFLQNKQTLKGSRVGGAAIRSSEDSGEYAEQAYPHHRPVFNRTELTWGKGDLSSGDPKDQLIIDREHAVPRQPLRRVNVLEPRLNPKIARTSLTMGREKKSHVIITQNVVPGSSQNGRVKVKGTNPKQREVSWKGAQNSNLINVQIVFDNEVKASSGFDGSPYSRRDPKILTLRNSEDNNMISKTPSQQQIFQTQQRAQSSLQQAKRHKMNYNELVPTQTAAVEQETLLSHTIHMITAETKMHSRQHDRLETLTDDCVLIDKESTGGHATRPQTKTITVNLDLPTDTQKGQANTLIRQEVNHSFYKGEKTDYQPMSEYAYNNFGNIINQHKKNQKKPTVSKYIKKATLDLSNQIKGQREYLQKVLGERLKEYDTNGSQQSQSKSPVNNISTQFGGGITFNSSQASQRQTQVEVKSSVNQISVQGTTPSSKWHSSRRQNLTTTEADAENLLVKELFEKMQWKQTEAEVLGETSTGLQVSKDSIESASQMASFNILGSKLFPQEKSPWGAPLGGESSITPIKILQQNEAEETDAKGTALRKDKKGVQSKIPNSTVPQAFRPLETFADSTLLNSCLARQGSNTSSEVDKNILNRMKEFETLGQQLFGICGSKGSQQQSPTQKREQIKVSQAQIPSTSILQMSQQDDQQNRKVGMKSQLEAEKLPFQAQNFDTFGKYRVDESSNRETLRIASEKSKDNMLIQNSPSLRITGYKKNMTQANTLPISRVHSALKEPSVTGKAVNKSQQSGASRENQEIDMETMQEGLQVFQNVAIEEVKRHTELEGETTPQMVKEGETTPANATQQDLSPIQVVQNDPMSKSPTQKPKISDLTFDNNNFDISQSNLRKTNVAMNTSKFEAFSTSTLLQGDQSGISIVKDNAMTGKNRGGNWTQFSSITPTQIQLDGKAQGVGATAAAAVQAQNKTQSGSLKSSERDKTGRFRQGVTQTNMSGLLNLKVQSINSTTPLEETSTPQISSHIQEQDQEEATIPKDQKQQNPVIIKFVYETSSSDAEATKRFVCDIDIKKILQESTLTELTSEQFEDQCFAYFRKEFVKAREGDEKQEELPERLELTDAKGFGVESILDWLQTAVQNGETDFTLIVTQAEEEYPQVLESSTNVIDSIKIAQSSINETDNMSDDVHFSLKQLTLKKANAKEELIKKKKQKVLKLSTINKKKASKVDRQINNSSQMSAHNDLVVIGRQSAMSYKEGSRSPKQSPRSNHNKSKKSPQSTKRNKQCFDQPSAVNQQNQHKIGEMMMQQQSFEDSKLQEDSLFSVTAANTASKPQNKVRNDSADELFDNKAFTANNANSGVDFINIKHGQQIKNEEDASRDRDLSQQQTQPKSNFHNYVCMALLEQLEEKPVVLKKNLEERLSNPASKTTRSSTFRHRNHRLVTVGAGDTQEPKEMTASTKGEGISMELKRQYLKNFYRKPIAEQFTRLSSLSPLEPKNSLGTSLTDNPLLSSIIRDSSHLPSVVGRNSIHGSNTFAAFSKLNSTRSSLQQQSQRPSEMIARPNLLSEKWPVRNAIQIGSQNAGSKTIESSPDKKLLSATWYGKKPQLLQKQMGHSQQNRVIHTSRTTLLQTTQEMKNKSVALSSRSVVPRPLQKRLTLPLNGAKSVHDNQSMQQSFIPVRAIQVPFARTSEVNRRKEDFGNMKNLFLANCLKIKDGEQGFSEEMQKTISMRIKANRGGLSPIVRKKCD